MAAGIVTAVGLLNLIACESPDEDDPIVARVDTATLSLTALDDQIPGIDLAIEERRAVIDKWLQQELLYQEALLQGIAEKSRVQRLVEQATRDLVVAAYIDEMFEDAAIEISDNDVEQYYHLHSERYTRDEPEIRALHILVGSQRDANTLRQALLRGESFEDKARDLSLDADTHMQGGDLGFFTADQYPELWEACANLKPGQTSRSVSTERGYHIVRLLERKDAGTIKQLADVEELVRIELIRGRHQQRLDDLVTRLKDEHTWLIDETLFELP